MVKAALIGAAMMSGLGVTMLGVGGPARVTPSLQRAALRIAAQARPAVDGPFVIAVRADGVAPAEPPRHDCHPGATQPARSYWGGRPSRCLDRADAGRAGSVGAETFAGDRRR